jgi:hypothetical protein
MRNRGWLATVARVLVLAVPFVVINLWLAASVKGFGAHKACMGIVHALALCWLLVIVRRRLSWPGLLLASLLYLLALMLCGSEAASWFMQGSSFNERFFAHLDLHNAAVSLRAYPWAIILGLLGALVLSACAVSLLATAGRRPFTWRIGVLACLLLLVAARVNAPPRRLYHYLAKARQTEALAESGAGARIRAMLDSSPSRPDDIVARPGKNLVFVYLESLERTYTDASRFPGLTPNIDRWRHQGLDFSGFQTFPGATYTIAGIFSSECGAPYLINSVFGSDIKALGFVPGNDSTSASTFHPELACLGDILHAAGYHQTYLSGVSLEFANTDQFFHMHRYDDAWGAPQIQKLHGGKLRQEGWGLLDTDMFSETLAQYRKGEASGKPFSVVMSTIDTHPPQGYVLPGCKHYTAIDNAMLDAVHCGDQVLGRFLDQLSHEPGWKDTMVVVMSDHVAMRNVASPLYPPDAQRQPLLFVLNAGQGDRPARMYHMDIAPTVLDLMGVKSNARFLAGASRAAAKAVDSPLPADSVAEAVVRDALWEGRKPPVLCQGGELARWDAKRDFEIGGWSLPFMSGGWYRSKLQQNHVLAVFVGEHEADLEMLPFGNHEHWIEQAGKMGKSVFLVMPFWQDGKQSLAMHWLAPNGAWASLGQVPDVSSIDLHSGQCRSMLDALRGAKPGARLDFSGAFGAAPLPAKADLSPVMVSSMGLPPAANDYGMFMFQRIRAEQTGLMALRVDTGNGVFMHPGSDRTTWAEFDVSDLASVTLAPHINALTPGCARHPDAGVVGVTISLDGRPVMPRFVMDRNYARTFALDTKGARRLRVEVDKGNGDITCDWFSLGFPALQMRPAVAEHVSAH